MKKVILKTINITILIFLLAIPGCYLDDSDPGYRIKYEVIAQDSYDWNTIYGIEYNDNSDSNIWVGDAPASPWTHQFVTDQEDFHIYIRAIATQCDGSCTDFNSSITVNLYINNKLYESKIDDSEVVIDDLLSNYL